ncbi:regulatory protein RecX [Dickeya solani]|uniref:Uncharacterized protein n=1 Tax=Dickeya solani TaxID=1089444 RepID=A0AAX4EWQ0_9GAMM|nr:hypothetical protein [Dickeya solani]WOA51757.1 hypothetical protein RXA29_17940 [Dickeya solani]
MSDTGYYKFHDAAYTDLLLAGEWFVSSLDYFSYMELKSADQWIGDHTESGIIYRGDGELSWEGGNTPPEDAYMRSQGLVGGGPLQGITLVDPTICQPEWPAHIISLCHGEYAPCAYAMLEEPEPQYRYNACLEISDIKGFARALWEEGATASGVPLRELFKEPLVGPMIYSDREAIISDQIPLRSGYFFKRATYAKQREFRIVLPHLNKWCIRDRLRLRLPSPERFLSLRLAGKPSPKSDDRPPDPDLIEETKSFYERMCAAKAMDDAKRVCPPVHDPEMLAEIKRILEELHHAADVQAARAKNSDAIKRIQDAKLAENQAEHKHSIRFQEENTVALRDLLWRWRLEKLMRFRSDLAYLMRPQMRYLEELHAAISVPGAAEEIIHMRG